MKRYVRWWIRRVGRTPVGRAGRWLGQQAARVQTRRVALASLFAVLGWIVYQQIASNALLIEPIIMPPKYEELGWTGETMSRRIRQELYNLDRVARQSRSALRANAIELRLTLPVEIPAMLQIQVPGTGVSLTTLVELVRQTVNKPSPRVQGEVVLAVTPGAGVTIPAEMTVRIATPSEYLVLPAITADEPATLARCAAERVMREVNPLLFALGLYHQGEYGAAREIMSGLIRDANWNASQAEDIRSDAFNLLGNILLSQRDYDGAVIQYKAAMQLDARNANAYVNQAMAHHRRWREKKERVDSEQALAMYQKALMIDPDDPGNDEIYVNMGIAYQDLGDLESAMMMYQRALGIDPGNANALINWGVALGLQKKFVEAIAKFEQAIEKDRRHPDAYVNWGYALGLQGQFDDAYERFRVAEEIAPNYAAVYSNWAEILEKDNQAEKAVQMNQRAKQLLDGTDRAQQRVVCMPPTVAVRAPGLS